MTNIVLIKRSATANAVPTGGQLANGEIAINYADGNLFFKDSGGSVQTLASKKFVSVTGNITGGNVETGIVSATGNVIAGNLNAAGLSLSSNVVSALVSAANITTTANIAGGYFIGNGSQLTGLPASYNDANVATFLANFGSNTVSTSGNVTTGNLTVNGNITYVNSNVVTINDKFINVANNAATSGAANGGGLGVGPVDAEYATLIFNNGTTAWNTNIPLSVNGNVAGSYFVGNGSALTSISGASVTGNVANATYAVSAGSAGSAVTAEQVTFAVQANITGVGTLGNLSVSGNTTVGNLSTGGFVSATGNVTGGNVTTTGLTQTATLSVTGNVIGNLLPSANVTYDLGSSTQRWKDLYLSGNTIQLGSQTISANATSVSLGADAELAANNVFATNQVSGATVSASGNIVAGGNLITEAAVSAASVSASSNITGGNLLTAGYVSATGNVSGNFFIGNGSQLTGIAGGGGNYSNANVATFLADFGSNVISTTGNISGGNLNVTGNIVDTSALSIISGSNGNITLAPNGTGNVNISANVSVTGNIVTSGAVLPRVVSIADGVSITMNGDTTDIATQTNTQAAGTLTINAVTGTLFNGQKIILRLQSANVQTFSWNAIFAGSTDLSLPTTSSGSNKYDYVGFIYNTTAVKWQLLAKNFGF